MAGLPETSGLPRWCILLDDRDRAHELIRIEGLPDRAVCLHEPECAESLKPVDLTKFRVAPEQHTPDPWVAEVRETWSRVTVAGTREGGFECRTRDVYLVAASPDLQRACRRALEALRPSAEHADVVAELERALSKANGSG